MPEVTRQMKVMQIKYVCDACGDGQYQSTGIALLTMPEQYPHVCDSCGDKVIFDCKYPSMQYVEN